MCFALPSAQPLHVVELAKKNEGHSGKHHLWEETDSTEPRGPREVDTQCWPEKDQSLL